MQIEKQPNFIAITTTMDSDAILDQLILLTEQYKRLNELLENKQNLLRQRALVLKKRRLKTKCDMQRMWIQLSNGDQMLEPNDSSSSD